MFLGTFDTNIMDKGRLALPKKIREELGGGRMVATIGFEVCIFGFREKEWEHVTETELTRPLFSDRQGRDLRRKMYSEATNIELDGQGRFVLPKSMIEYARIKSDVVVIGTGDHFEIWSTSVWRKYRESLANVP